MRNQYNFLNSLNLDQDVKERLSINLDRILSGSNEIYRTPLGKGMSQDELLSKFDLEFRDKIQSYPVKYLAEFEESNRVKFGPRSIMLPWVERRSSVKQYFESNNSVVNCSDLFVNKDKVGLRPLSLMKASDFLKNNTNSGLPFLRRKGLVKAKVLDNFNMLLSRRDPCVMFTRTQENNKTRTVWGFPVADTLNEMMFYRPLLDYQRKLSWRSALLGPDQVNENLDRLIKSALVNGQTLVSIDFSAYDASVKPEIQKCAFDYIKSLFQSRYSDSIDYIADRFKSIGLITPEGVLNGDHGVPSGSTFTNEIDSISQFIIARSNEFVDVSNMQIQGDDGVYAVDESNVTEFLHVFSKYGLKVNIDKSLISSDKCVYLQNLYHKDIKVNGRICGIYPIYRAYNRLIFQESWDDFEDYGINGRDYYSIRSISILENCKYHPLFKDFVSFIHKMDKYGLQTSQVGLSRYIEMMTNKLGTEGLIINQYGDNIKGIRNFETFKIIKQLGNG